MSDKSLYPLQARAVYQPHQFTEAAGLFFHAAERKFHGHLAPMFLAAERPDNWHCNDLDGRCSEARALAKAEQDLLQALRAYDLARGFAKIKLMTQRLGRPSMKKSFLFVLVVTLANVVSSIGTENWYAAAGWGMAFLWFYLSHRYEEMYLRSNERGNEMRAHLNTVTASLVIANDSLIKIRDWIASNRHNDYSQFPTLEQNDPPPEKQP